MKKRASDPVTEQYNEAVKSLDEYEYARELERRKWAGENWKHPDGRVFHQARIVSPLLSFFALFGLIIYCLIRWMQLFRTQMGTVIVGTDEYASLSYEADVRNVNFYLVVMSICAIALVTGNVLLVMKRYKPASVLVAASTLLISLHMFTQLNIPMPDNSMYDGAPFISYQQLCVGVAIFCIVSLIYSAAIIVIYVRDDIERRRNLEAALEKVANSHKGRLPDLEDYPPLIEKYMKKREGKPHD